MLTVSYSLHLVLRGFCKKEVINKKKDEIGGGPYLESLIGRQAHVLTALLIIYPNRSINSTKM